jgi:signal transduction histidine kinase/ligand-binding sensor domain-containing protein
MNFFITRLNHLCVCILFFAGNRVIAQDHGFFQQVWQEEGLSQSSVTAFIQDQQGFMWIGTQDGLNRYDGKRVDKFNAQPFTNSISSNFIQCIGNVADDKLCVHSMEGVDLLDIHTLETKHLLQFLKGEHGERLTIFKTWILDQRVFMLSQQGISELETGNKQEKNIRHYKIERCDSTYKILNVFSAQIDDKKTVFLTTTEGIYSCPEGSFTFRPFKPASASKEEKEIFTKECFALFYKKNKLYFSQGNILYSYHLITHKLSSFHSNPQKQGSIQCAIVDNQDKIWMGTNGDGLYRLYEKADGEFLLEKHFKSDSKDKYGLKCNVISCLFQGSHPNEDVVWIGSAEAGAFSYSYSKNSFEYISALLDKPGQSFFSIAKDKDNTVWASTGTGIYRIDRSARYSSFIDLQQFAIGNIRLVISMYCDNNCTWVGFNNTLFTIDKKENKLVKVAGPLLPNEPVNRVFKIIGHGDSLFIGTGHGLVVYNKMTGTINPYQNFKTQKEEIRSPFVEAIAVDKHENWWIGTRMGLLWVDRQHKKNQLYSYDPVNKNSLLSNSIMDIKESDEGDILVGTSSGLSLFTNPYGQLRIENYYSPFPGITNNYIYGMAKDKEGIVWLTSNYGLMTFNTKKKMFRSYHASEGTYINEFNSYSFCSSPDGEVLFGGIDGLIGIYPEKLNKKGVPPVLVVRDFKINQQNADSLLSNQDQVLELNHDQNSLYLEFSIPDFSADQYKLYFLLEGVQNSWTAVGASNSFSLVNLAPGSYVLKIKALNEEGTKSSRPFILSIHIQPPLWKSTGFLILYLVVFVISLMLFYKYRLHNKLAREKEIHRIRQHENEQVRKAAALDLHDEFGNGLTRISVLTETLKIKIPEENQEILRSLDTITENCSRLYQGTKDFIWSIHPGNDNLYETIIRLKDFGDDLFYGSGIDFEVDGLEEEFNQLHHLPATGRHITMIIKEALANVLKHSKATHVNLLVIKTGSIIRIQLKDNGRGFNSSVNKNSFGISNMQQRAAKASLDFSIASSAEEGTIIRLSTEYTKTNSITYV